MGMIFGIQRGCTDDGPGIRTTVFLKGCPLRCLWCHNPESQASAPQHSADTGRIIGYEASPGQVMETVLADLPYYRATGGGMTVSGGEPLEQADFTRALLSLAKKKGIHTCVETCGFAPWSTLEAILADVGLFLFDIKAAPADHLRFTGVEAEPILDNLDRLCRTGARVLLRCPVIPGCNDTEAHFAFLKSLLQKYPSLEGLQIMPYHNLGVGKARRLGMACPLALPNPSPGEIARWRKALDCDDNNFCPGQAAPGKGEKP